MVPYRRSITPPNLLGSPDRLSSPAEPFCSPTPSDDVRSRFRSNINSQQEQRAGSQEPLMPTMTSPRGKIASARHHHQSSLSSWRRQSILRRVALLTAALFCSRCPSIPSVEARTSSSSSAARSRYPPDPRSLLLRDKDDRESSASSDDDDTQRTRRWVARSGLARPSVPSFVQRRTTSSSILPGQRKRDDQIDNVERSILTNNLLKVIRGGGSDSDAEDGESQEEEDAEDDDEAKEVVEEEEGEDESADDEYDSEEEEDDEGEYDPDVEDEEEEEEIKSKSPSSSLSLKSSILSKSHDGPAAYDYLLTPPAMQQLFISVGVMFLSNRIDILNERAVRIARFAFLAYVISVQIFLLYVTLRAKSVDDRTPVKISSPFASLLPPGLVGGGGNFVVKAIADQVLSTSTTVLEYDLKMAKKMNGGLLFPMLFLYFLHFKMKQVQPLLMQTATGFVNLVYSPLFQVYVLGRNLERPFRPPVTTNPMMEALKQQMAGGEGDGGGVGAVGGVSAENDNAYEEKDEEGGSEEGGGEEEEEEEDDEDDES